MPKYRVEQYELHCATYEVDADSEAKAIAVVFDGGAEVTDTGYIEVADDFGMPADEHRELADALRNRGIIVDEVIPSIRSIEEVG